RAINLRSFPINYTLFVTSLCNYVQSTTVRNSSRGANDELWNNVNRLMSAEKLFLTSDPTLESLAKEAGTNRTYLSRTINTFSGKNFSSYVDGFRIREATRIIEASKKSVSFKQIAEMVGYTSVPVFYKAFVREVGLSPGRYRDDIMRRKA
ncbi:helix-turn-helix domain-containing protein, partial [Alistipes sp.]|uniref:helix-turn-helix domain-containing protein n=1 Tax=Alistipes sp. TaxID=1872444 RepID=UPI00402A1207